MRMTWMLPLLFLAGTGLSAGKPEADLILKNGRIYTLDPARPIVRALAISGGRILAVGQEGDMAAWAGPGTEVLDLRGAAAYPGFVDAHAHVYGLGKSAEVLDLTGARSEAEAVRLVAREAAGTPPGQWVLGRGWDQNRWPGRQFPTETALSQASPDHPVALTRVDGHAFWVNRRALEAAGVDRATPAIAGGEVLRDAAGDPSGILIDNAMDLVQRRIPEPSPELIRRRLLGAMRRCTQLGLTQVHDAGVSPDMLAAYENILAAGEMPLRIYAMLEDNDAWLRQLLPAGIRQDPAGMLVVRSVKLYADGALGSRGAWLEAPYADRPDTAGLPVSSRDHLLAVSRLCAQYGFQACTHAIGDRANREILDVYQQVLTGLPDGRDRRFRVEHVQVLRPLDIPRFAELGVIPSMQPTHCTSDMPWAEDRLGGERVRFAYAWRSLIAAGSIIPMGSDFPIEGPDPLAGFYAAVTRQDRQGKPGGGWFPKQRMTREEALRSMTLWAATAAFQEREKGSLAPGKWADITVCSRDIMRVPAREILSARIVATIVGGRIVYRKNSGE